MDRRYKPLRPALASQGSDGDRDGQGEAHVTQKRKRAQVKVACDTCRTKKSACDGQRPVCAACVRRGSPCTFGGRSAEASDSSPSHTPHPAETDRNSSASELLSLLTSLPPETAQGLLTDIKVYGDFSLALAHIRGGPGGQPGKAEGIATLSPPDQGSVEFELMLRHPMLYPAAAPLDLPLDPTQVFFHQNRKIDGGQNPSRRTTSQLDAAHIVTSIDAYEASSVQPSLPTTPALTENGLELVNFANWTHVSIDNLEAADAISRYLEVDHPILGFFDADLFLQDLCNYESRFCSELLVNSLLSWACLDTSGLLVSEADRSEEFFSEATKQLTAEKGIDTIPKLVSLELLSLRANFLGSGDKGKRFLGQAIAMGQRMGLLNEARQAISDAIELRAACHCAWGLFSYASLHGFQCQQGEFGILQPPKLPLPTTTSTTDANTLFRALCQLWALMYEMLSRYFERGPMPTSLRFDPGFVHVMLGRLLTFADQLPLQLARGNRVSHGGIILHIFIHAAIITLLRPLVLDPDREPHDRASLSKPRAMDITKASIHQLRRCITIYEHHFARRWPTVFWHTGCLFLANYAIRSNEPKEVRSRDLRLALNGYRTLYPRYPVTLLVAKGLLTMAAAAQLTTAQEAYDYIRELRARGPNTASLDPPTEACFMVDLDTALVDQGSAHVDHLAQRFDDMVMFDEFTHGRMDLEGGVRIQ